MCGMFPARGGSMKLRTWSAGVRPRTPPAVTPPPGSTRPRFAGAHRVGCARTDRGAPAVDAGGVCVKGLRLILFTALVSAGAAAGAAAQDRAAFLAGATIHCPGCDLRGAKLDRRDLTGADLSGANLAGATFSRTVLRGANLAGADLTGANLKRHDLTGADLSGANLRDPTFHRAVLRGANLSGADLTGANPLSW